MGKKFFTKKNKCFVQKEKTKTKLDQVLICLMQTVKYKTEQHLHEQNNIFKYLQMMHHQMTLVLGHYFDCFESEISCSFLTSCAFSLPNDFFRVCLSVCPSVFGLFLDYSATCSVLIINFSCYHLFIYVDILHQHTIVQSTLYQPVHTLQAK